MKRPIKYKKVLVFVCFGIILMLVGIVIGWKASFFFVPKKTTNLPSYVDPVKNPELTLLSLPGTAPIRAFEEDYHNPGSLWVVVSKSHPLKNTSYVPENIAIPKVAVNSSKSAEEQSVRSDITQNVEELFTAAKEGGHDIMLASGYRSYDLQQRYYSNYVRTSGESEANKYSAKPGQSEHQTGLAFDISSADRHCYLETCFGETAAGRWLAANAYLFGFILRYPAEKTAVTQYQYEPWHFRYVGKDLARALKESGLTLDEAYPYFESTRAELIKRGIVNDEN